MASQQVDPERRKATRYVVKEHTFAVVRSNNSYDIGSLDEMSRGQVGIALFKSKPAKMGQIIDLSLRGLCFNYIVNDESITEGGEIDILFAEENFYLGALPCHIVREKTKSNELPFTPIVMKQRAVAFDELSTYQKDTLRRFLRAHGQEVETETVNG
jgi:hypothetical protein